MQTPGDYYNQGLHCGIACSMNYGMDVPPVERRVLPPDRLTLMAWKNQTMSLLSTLRQVRLTGTSFSVEWSGRIHPLPASWRVFSARSIVKRLHAPGDSFQKTPLFSLDKNWPILHHAFCPSCEGGPHSWQGASS